MYRRTPDFSNFYPGKIFSASYLKNASLNWFRILRYYFGTGLLAGTMSGRGFVDIFLQKDPGIFRTVRGTDSGGT